MTVTSNDVRHFMLDRTAGDNFLLDDVEVDEATISHGMRFFVDLYNSMPPLVDAYEVDDFPYRAEMVMGVAAYCLRANAMNLRRNEAASRTEGGTVLDDRRGKAEAYLSVAAALQGEALQRLKAIKVAKNVESCYSSFW